MSKIVYLRTEICTIINNRIHYWKQIAENDTHSLFALQRVEELRTLKTQIDKVFREVGTIE